MNKTNLFSATKNFLFLPLCAGSVFFFSSCNDDEIKKEDTPEMITEVNLIFTPVGGGATVTATATDPDGEGVQDIQTDGPIILSAQKTYTLELELINGLEDPSNPGYDISEEVEEEADEHQFFFSWTNNVFSNPSGNGNIDNRNDPVNYSDEDVNGLPLGLETSWTTASAASGKFRILLKHQPEIKSATSSSADGETDLDIEFDVTIQ